MSKILVFGHKSTDTDSICSAIVMADLEKYLGNDTGIACRLGEINKETASENLDNKLILMLNLSPFK